MIKTSQQPYIRAFSNSHSSSIRQFLHLLATLTLVNFKRFYHAYIKNAHITSYTDVGDIELQNLLVSQTSVLKWMN